MTKILIVEDDRSTSGLLKTVFQMEGFKTSVCPDPARVLQIVREERPDVVLMDFHLAETESLPVLKEMKKDPNLQAIPVVMTSGLDRGLECKQAGADNFVLKPFRPAALLAEIRAVLNE